jgi:2-polyprenyl-3-methyl-5-hydroxy-6-metoxy-1,4-benzoquinol methylase
MRPTNFSRIAEGVIMKWFDPSGVFLDYGGGNGVFVRMMRDRGFNFYRYDKYAANVYSIGFDLSDVQDRFSRFDLLTSIEVLEHFEDPVEEISKMVSLSDNILFTTALNDDLTLNELRDWWYISEYTGQHISFYSKKCLNIIADKYDYYFYSNNVDTHFFSKTKIKNISFTQEYNLDVWHKIRNKLVNGIDRVFDKAFNSKKAIPAPLTQKDSDYVKKLLIEQQNDGSTKNGINIP